MNEQSDSNSQIFVRSHVARDLLQKWRNASVFINNHECEFSEPTILDQKIFRPDGELKDIIGNLIKTLPLCGLDIMSLFDSVT